MLRRCYVTGMYVVLVLCPQSVPVAADAAARVPRAPQAAAPAAARLQVYTTRLHYTIAQVRFFTFGYFLFHFVFNYLYVLKFVMKKYLFASF